MSHITCKYCGSNEHYSGYGLAMPISIGAYTWCAADGCERLLEFSADTDGLSEAEAKKVEDAVAAYFKAQDEAFAAKRGIDGPQA